jgi:hypothetical protein
MSVFLGFVQVSRQTILVYGMFWGNSEQYGRAMVREQRSLPPARVLLILLAFHRETSHAITKISRISAGTPTYAT